MSAAASAAGCCCAAEVEVDAEGSTVKNEEGLSVPVSGEYGEAFGHNACGVLTVQYMQFIVLTLHFRVVGNPVTG